LPNPLARIRPIRLGATASLRRFGRDRRGVTIIELAFVAGPLMAMPIAMLIAILQGSLTFFAQEHLETAAEKSTRVLMTPSRCRS
jgi:Flp pilus assembly protein TadG